jgi:3-keto-5-aminohexanoate cleavage enzyme
MDPLMITATCGLARPKGSEPRPDRPEEVIDSVARCWEAGACIAQVRAPFVVDPRTGKAATRLEDWTRLVEGIRARCDVIVQIGVAGGPVEERRAILEACRPNIASFLISHHDIVVGDHDIYQLVTRPQAIRMLQMHVELGVIPSIEIFNGGALWNLSHCLKAVAVPRPLHLTIFFWEGGQWTPPSVEQLLLTIRELPPDASYNLATAHCPDHTLLHAVTIGRGGHVRVGLGDHYPWYSPGRLAQSNAELVERMVRLAGELGRPVASPAQARAMLGIRSA